MNLTFKPTRYTRGIVIFVALNTIGFCVFDRMGRDGQIEPYDYLFWSWLKGKGCGFVVSRPGYLRGRCA